MSVHGGPPAGPDARWRDPAWLAQVSRWIDERLTEQGIERTGAIEQPHVYPWSTVLRLPSTAGTLWFKANTEALRHEVTVVATVAARRPDLVPPLLAADVVTGWMLMADAGSRLREIVAREASLHRWHEVLGRYAGLQLDLTEQVPELLAAGVPDLRLHQLPRAYGFLLDGLEERQGTGEVARYRSATSTVDELCDELASYGLPELLQHDDLHDGQVYVRPTGPVLREARGANVGLRFDSARDEPMRILDWGDACISHPFFTLAVTLEGVLAWGLDDVRGSVDTAPFRDSYLAPFAARLDRDPTELTSAVVPALRLGWACRAVNGHVVGDDAKTLTRLRMFLDGSA